MTSLDAWNEQFGGIDPFTTKKADGFDWEFDIAYPVEISGAEVVKSQRGDVQLKVSLVIKDSDHEDAGEHGRAIEYFTLPKQESDLSRDFETVTNLTKRRMADVVRILSAANREEYALYDRMEIVKGKKVYYDFEHREMSSDAFAARQSHIHDMIVMWIDKAHENIGKPVDELALTRLYVSKKENKKTPKYPYTNLYALRPDKVKVFGDNEAPF